MEQEFNINGNVRVQLFDDGKQIFREHYSNHSPEKGDVLKMFGMDEEGWVTLQMWAFMEIFGPHTLSHHKAFNFNVRIILPDVWA